MELFGEKFAELIPEWSKDRLLGEDRSTEKFTFVRDRMIKHDKRLGRGLKDIKSLPPSSLKKLLLK
ncbi:hypothetical protein KAR91_80140 [Candidatus Pacearchaeota archaeon]|nr:hypothetical protein [Candidatus Pacearchaeota archaeon]